MQLCRRTKELTQHWAEERAWQIQRKIVCLVREKGVKQVSESVSRSHQWSSTSMNLSKTIFLSQMACNSEVKANVLLLANSYVPPSSPWARGWAKWLQDGEGKGSPPLGRTAHLYSWLIFNMEEEQTQGKMVQLRRGGKLWEQNQKGKWRAGEQGRRCHSQADAHPPEVLFWGWWEVICVPINVFIYFRTKKMVCSTKHIFG